MSTAPAPVDALPHAPTETDHYVCNVYPDLTLCGFAYPGDDFVDDVGPTGCIVCAECAPIIDCPICGTNCGI